MPVSEAHVCAGILCKALSANAPCAVVAASVIPYPVSVVGLPVKLVNDCAGILVKNELVSGGVYVNTPVVLL